MTDTLSWEKFTLFVPRLVLAIVDALHAAQKEHGAGYRLYEVYDDGGPLVGLEFGTALFVGAPVATELQELIMSDGLPREDEFLLSWDWDALPTLGDLHATLERAAAANPDLVLDDIDPIEVLTLSVVDPFAVPPAEVLFGYDMPVSVPLESAPLRGEEGE